MGYQTIHLTPRLDTVASCVPPGSRLADVGTDHAYLPAALLIDGTIPSAIVSDVRPGPLERARETARRYQCVQNMDFRLCDGLSGIGPQEVDAIVLAGMGGETIVNILSQTDWLKSRRPSLVLQPMSTLPKLREWLGCHGFEIVREQLAQENRGCYVVMEVAVGTGVPLTLGEQWAGRQSQDPLRGIYLKGLMQKLQGARQGLAQSRGQEQQARYELLGQVYHQIAQMKEEWDGWQQ